MRDGHHRRGKAFEESELVQAAVNLWLNEMRFESHAQAATGLGVHRSAVWRWRKRKSRPDTTALRRMIRLSLWQAEGWHAAWFRSVAWEDLSVEFVEGRELPNPFFLTPPTSTSSGVTFPFGSLRDCGPFLRALMDRFGVESKGHLIALLGMPHNTSAYDQVRHWTHGQWAIGPQYLARVLVLVLWAAKPHRFAALSDLWGVDWPGRSVEWTKRRQHEWESDGSYASPPSPFHPLLAFAQRSNGRGGPRRARAKSFEAPVAPVRAYELAQGASQV